MTKLKSKKMTKSTFAIIIMAIAMVAMLAFGGTYAYFSAVSNDLASGTITTATVLLDGTTLDIDASNVLPGDTITSSAIQVTDKSTVATYIVVQLKTTDSANLYQYLKFGGDNAFTKVETVPTGAETGATYYVLKTEGAATATTGTPYTFATDITVDANWNLQSTNGSAATGMGASITLTFACKSIQAKNVTQDQAITTLFKAA